MSTRRVRHVTCLGCGCACDDLEVTVGDGRIVAIEPRCGLARDWFGDGAVPDRVLAAGRPVTPDRAIAAAAELLSAHAGRVLVFLGADLSSEALRAAVALADLLRATVDGTTSPTAAAGLLAAQRRGRAAGTLGEIRNRADLVLCWAVDPAARYPRYFERYAPPRSGRALVSVSVGADRGPREAEAANSLTPDQEVPALSVLRAVAQGHSPGDLPPPLQPAARLGERLLAARYAAILHDAEPGRDEARDSHRIEGLLALTQALNGPTRAVLSSLRAGGNRSGLEAVLTWQTGFPMAVDFSDGLPRYLPARRGLDRLGAGEFAAVLVAGTAAEPASAAGRGPIPTVVVGPRASEAWSGADVAIDTGIAGVHEGGTGYRMDEVALPLTPPLPGARSARETLEGLLQAVARRLGRAS